MNNRKVAFIGGGNMGQAIVRGLLRAGHAPNLISIADPDSERRAELLALNDRLNLGSDNDSVAQTADVLVLAVKSQLLSSVAKQIGDTTRPASQLILSIAAGTTSQTLAGWLGDDVPVVRVMPNQPALIGAGISALFASANVTASSRQLADYIAGAIGQAVWLDDEQLMDAAAAVSGSGPAYFYLLMEIIEQSARGFGFSKEIAGKLTRATALGAARVADTESAEPGELRKQVTSPGGTTAAAVTVLEDAGIHAIFRRALEAAKRRSAELGEAGPHTD